MRRPRRGQKKSVYRRRKEKEKSCSRYLSELPRRRPRRALDDGCSFVEFGRGVQLVVHWMNGALSRNSSLLLSLSFFPRLITYLLTHSRSLHPALRKRPFSPFQPSLRSPQTDTQTFVVFAHSLHGFFDEIDSEISKNTHKTTTKIKSTGLHGSIRGVLLSLLILFSDLASDRVKDRN